MVHHEPLNPWIHLKALFGCEEGNEKNEKY